MHEIEQCPIRSKWRMINSETSISGVMGSLSRRCARGYCNGDRDNNSDRRRHRHQIRHTCSHCWPSARPAPAMLEGGCLAHRGRRLTRASGGYIALGSIGRSCPCAACIASVDDIHAPRMCQHTPHPCRPAPSGRARGRTSPGSVRTALLPAAKHSRTGQPCWDRGETHCYAPFASPDRAIVLEGRRETAGSVSLDEGGGIIGPAGAGDGGWGSWLPPGH